MNIYRGYTRTKLSDLEFCAVMHGLNLRFNHSMVWQSRTAMLKAAGISGSEEEMYKWIAEFYINYERKFHYTADVFNVMGDILYVMNTPDHSPFEQHKIEVGVITTDEEKARTMLSAFAKAFKDAVSTMLDGRTARHKAIKWLQDPEIGKVDWHVRGRKKYSNPDLNEEIIQMLDWFINDKSRAVIRESAEHGARVFRSYHRREDETYSTLVDKMIVEGVLVIEREKIQLTVDARKLQIKSHWMTVWLTRLLLDLGIGERSIVWNVEENGNEVDLVVQYKTKTWIFELKDKNFEIDRTHSLPFRMREFKGDKVFVITTGIVSKDALLAIREIKADVVIIEGLNNVRERIEVVMRETQLAYIEEVQKELSKRMDIALAPIFKKMYGDRKSLLVSKI